MTIPSSAPTTYPGNHRGWLIAAWVLWGLLVFADLFYLLLMQIMDLNRVNQPPPLLPLILCVTSGVIVVVAVAARLGGGPFYAPIGPAWGGSPGGWPWAWSPRSCRWPSASMG